MLTEIIVYRCKIKEEVKAIQSEMKRNVQGTSIYSKGMETRTQIINLEQKEEINIQSEQKEETRT